MLAEPKSRAPDGPAAAAIFASVGQALHVAHLFAHLPMTVRVSTQVVIESLQQQAGKVEARLNSTLNTEGMSRLEFRGQCALVMASAERHLPIPELAAIRCRHGHEQTQIDGMHALAEYLRPRSDLDATTLLFVVGSHYLRGGQRARRGVVTRPSLRRIHTETGASMHALGKALALVRQVGEELEALAEDRLRPSFVHAGLTPAEER